METKKDYQIEFKDFKAFEQSVLESSLINTVFSTSNPEIGQLLHLEEIDPTLVRKYDGEIVNICIKNYMDSIIGTLNIPIIKKIIKKLSTNSPKEVKALKRKMKRLQKYIAGLKGITLSNDQKIAAQQWDAIQCAHQSAIDAINSKFKMSTWATALFCIPLGIPFGIRALILWNAQNEARNLAIEENIKASCNDLDQMYDMLQRLNDIKKIIEKQDLIEQAFNSEPISLKEVIIPYQGLF